MDQMDLYWKLVNEIFAVISIGIVGYCYYRFVKPYLLSVRAAKISGMTIFAVMLFLHFVPTEMTSAFAYMLGTAASFMVMVTLDKRNVEQKIFLSVTVYLLRWIAGGIDLFLRSIIITVVPYHKMDPWQQLLVFSAIEMVFRLLMFFGLLLLTELINKNFIYKKENLTKRELTLLIFPPLSVLLGYWIVTFLTDAYEFSQRQQIWAARTEYKWFLLLYQGVSFVAILAVIVVSQKIKESQREEKENAVLSGQIQDMKRHIGEVEKLYRDIRSLKHDMGNHVMTLKNLYIRKEYEEAENYASQLKSHIDAAEFELKSGNPVTDVVLAEKKKEAEEKNIVFTCDFHYPEDSIINAFDLSVILNNAITNAIEGTEQCSHPYVKITSQRKKNAYLIKIENSLSHPKQIDEESGLPTTTKTDQSGHGFGLVNIRKVAQKYFGDIDITQDKDSFTLCILLMTE